MSLGLPSWLLVMPKLALFDSQQAVFGGPNWTRLNVLKNSVRNCKPNFSSGPKLVVLRSARSQLLIPAPRSVGSTRDSFPNPKSLGAVKQFGLNQAIPPAPVTCEVPLEHPGATFGRKTPIPRLACDSGVEPPKLIGRGKPF